MVVFFLSLFEFHVFFSHPGDLGINKEDARRPPLSNQTSALIARLIRRRMSLWIQGIVPWTFEAFAWFPWRYASSGSTPFWMMAS